MSVFLSIPWGKVFSNFVWILGFSIILAAISHNEFFSQIQKTKRIEDFKNISFKTPFLLGSILITIGTALSVHKVWLVVFFGMAGLLFIILFFKTMKKHDN